MFVLEAESTLLQLRANYTKIKGKKKLPENCSYTHSGANLESFCSSPTKMTTTNDKTWRVLNIRKMKVQGNSQKDQEHSNCFTTEQDFSSCSPVSETGHENQD